MQSTYRLFDTDAKVDLCKTKPNVFVIDSEYKGRVLGSEVSNPQRNYLVVLL